MKQWCDPGFEPGVTAYYYPPDWSYLLGKNWLAQNYLPGINRLAKNYPAQSVITSSVAINFLRIIDDLLILEMA